MSTTPFARPGIDRAALLRAVEPVVHAHGAEVVDLEFRPERGGWTLRVFVEKEGAGVQSLSTKDAAISLDLCADVSRDLSPALDVADLIPHSYRLEVSSPGVERPLRAERDFIRFKGHKVKVRTRGPVGAEQEPGAAESSGGPVVVGVLDGIVDGRVRVIEGARTHEVPLASVESARLVFDFGSPGSRAQPGRRHRRKALHRKH